MRDTAVVAQIPTLAKENDYLVFEVCYLKGGISIFGGGHVRRGIYVLVRQKSIAQGMQSYGMFEGLRKLLDERSKFSQKQFFAVEDKIKRQIESNMDEIKTIVGSTVWSSSESKNSCYRNVLSLLS